MSRPSSLWYLIGAGIAVIGFAVLIVASSVTTFVAFAVGLDSLPRFSVPGHADVDLPAGNYTIYSETRSRVGGRTYTADAVPGMTCELTDPAGRPIELRSSSGSASYAIGSFAGESTYLFQAPAAGRYRLDCEYDREGPATVLALRHAGTSLTKVALFGLAGATLAGLAVCTVVFLRQRRWTRTHPPAAGTAPVERHASGWPGYPGGPSVSGPAGPAPPPPAWWPTTAQRPAAWPGTGPQPPAGPRTGAQPPVWAGTGAYPAGWPPAGHPGTHPTHGWPGTAVRPVGSSPAQQRGLVAGVGALVLAVFGVVIAAIPLAVVGLRGGRAGRGLAVAALAVSTAWLVAAVGAAAVLVPGTAQGSVLTAEALEPSSEPTTGPPTTAPPTSESQVTIGSVREGDCLISQDSQTPINTVPRVPCSAPHDEEVLGIVELEDGPWPGEDAVDDGASELCMDAAGDFIGIPAVQSELLIGWYTPVEEGWNQGDHEVICIVSDPAGRSTGSLRGSRR